MKRIAIAAVIAALASTPPIALGTNTEGCCACLETAAAQSGSTNGTATAALFCAAADAADLSSLEDRCASLSPQAKLTCIVNIPGPTCAVQLAGEGILCPASGAPAAGPLNLATLAVVLAAFGAVLVHRRRSSRPGR